MKAISKYYNEKGLKTRVYEASQENVDNTFDIKGNHLIINLKDYDVDSCTKEIKQLKTAEEVNITSLSKYIAYFSEVATNARAKKIKTSECF